MECYIIFFIDYDVLMESIGFYVKLLQVIEAL